VMPVTGQKRTLIVCAAVQFADRVARSKKSHKTKIS